MSALPALDPVFHQATRTRLALSLSIEEQSFSQLKSRLRITDGNLDAHLRKLSSAGFLHSRMVREVRPHTIYQLSNSGSIAFARYIEALESIVLQTRVPQR